MFDNFCYTARDHQSSISDYESEDSMAQMIHEHEAMPLDEQMSLDCYPPPAIPNILTPPHSSSYNKCLGEDLATSFSAVVRTKKVRTRGGAGSRHYY